MATIAAPQSALHEKFAKGPGLFGSLIFVAVLIAGVIYIGVSLSHDLSGLQAGSGAAGGAGI